jgi:tetratricopeptide (TPR) repeat protein
VGYTNSLVAASKAESQQSYEAAVQSYAEAAKFDPFSAETQFHWATCLLAQTNNVQAREHFEKARDYDALPFRADSRINQIIKETAGRYAGPDLVLSDAVALVSSHSPSRIAGEESFYEHVHFNFDGNYRLAQAWADQVSHLLPASNTSTAKTDWASQELCERRLGLTDWNRYAVLEDMLGRLSQPPFPAQANHKAQLAALRAQIKELRQSMNETAATRARQLYQEALQAAPEDHRLHENFAEFCDLTGALQEAVAEWERVSQLIPQHHLAYFQTGRLLRRMGKLDEATKWLEQAVTLRPDLAPGWLELGNIHAARGELELALKDYAREKELTPQDYHVYYYIARVLSRQKQSPDAIQNFRQSLKLQPNYWEAHYALGEELAFSDQTSEARDEFQATLRQKPDYAPAHLNLGVALLKLGDADGALREFAETQRLEPQNQTAQSYIQHIQQARATPIQRPRQNQ